MSLPPRPLSRPERLLAASSFTLTAVAAVLIWTAYKDRDAGISLYNALRCLGAGACIALAVKGTKLRHSPGR